MAGTQVDVLGAGGFRRVAVAIDDWPTHEAAIGLALASVAPGGEVIFVTAVNRAALTENCATAGDVTALLAALDVEEHRMLAAAASRAESAGVRSTTRVLDGGATQSLEEFAREAPYDVAIIGTRAHERTYARCLGAMAKAFLRLSPVPVMITCDEGAAHSGGGVRNVLAVLDGSIPQENVVTSAIALARRSGAGVVFAYLADDVSPHSVTRDGLTAARKNAANASVSAESIALYGFTSAAINAAAQVAGAGAMVLGAEERSRYHAPQPAAVINMLIRTAQIPLIVVPVRTPASIRRSYVA